MANDLIPISTEARPQSRDRNHARARIKAGRFEAQVEVDISSRGLLAVGGLVSMILLSVVPIVVAANQVARTRRHRF